MTKFVENLSGEEPGLTVVVPALNEEASIAETLDRLKALEPVLGIPMEIVVVDDGSTDATGRIADEKGVVLIRHPHSGGYGCSLKSGIRKAHYEKVGIVDADSTYPIEEFERMVELAETHDMVVGARTGALYRKSVLRSPIRSAFLALASFVTGKYIPDPNSGMRVFRRSQILELFDELPKGFSFTTTTTVIMTLRGHFIHYHPIEYGDRSGHSKIRFLPDTLRLAQTLLEVTLRHNPLKAFLLLAIASALIGVVGCFVVPGAGWQWLSGFLFAALIVFAIGMSAVVVRKGNPL